MANDYWRRRIQAEQEAKIERGATLSDEMDRLYQHHFKALETEIMAFEQRYANKNGIPISEVKSKVSDFDVKAFEEKAKRYVEEKNFSPKANAELELYNLKMKINRLELLQYQLDLEMVALGEAEHKLTDKFLNGEYIRTLEEQSGLLGQSVLNIRQVENVAQTVINTPFKGAVWSDRIWERQTMLRTIVAQMTEDYLLKGKNPTSLIPKIKKEFGVSASEAKRLAVTEGARVSTEAERQSYNANGYDEYEFIAEPSACKFCKPLDGKIFKVKDMEPGENAAPMHPNCHCSTAANFSMDKTEYERLIEDSWWSQYPHVKNVKDEWLLKNESQASVGISNHIIRNGVTYYVDGKDVVMDHSPKEYQVANWLSMKTGRHIDVLPRVSGIKGVSSPDYLIDGVFFDLKTPTGQGNVIDGNSRKAKSQAPNIIFDLTYNPLTNEEIMEQLNDVYRWGRRGLEVAIIKRGDELIFATKPNKKR